MHQRYLSKLIRFTFIRNMRFSKLGVVFLDKFLASYPCSSILRHVQSCLNMSDLDQTSDGPYVEGTAWL